MDEAPCSATARTALPLMDRMDAPSIFVGVDVASESLAVAVTSGLGRPIAAPTTTANDPDGFAALEAHLAAHGAVPERTLVCLEATGVYGEALCYWMHGRGYCVVVGDPATIRHRAMPVAGPKTDALDARRIADYAARYLDELRPWSPAEAVVEEVQTLLTMREQLVREVNAKRNALHVLRRKHHQTPLAIRIAEDAAGYLQARIREIDAEVRRLVSEHPTIGPAVALLVSVPGVGYLLAAHVVVATGGFTRPLSGKRFASYVGICPNPYQSGTSVERRSRSRGYGPRTVRKLLYMASLGLVRTEGPLSVYYRRKVGEGKSGRLVLNNLSNKLVRVMAAVLRDGVPYEAGHRSVRPAI